MRPEFIYPFGGWGLFQAGKLLMVMVTVVAIDDYARGNHSGALVLWALPGAFFVLMWLTSLVRWCTRLSRRFL
jgi:hypothetical protein